MLSKNLWWGMREEMIRGWRFVFHYALQDQFWNVENNSEIQVWEQVPDAVLAWAPHFQDGKTWLLVVLCLVILHGRRYNQQYLCIHPLPAVSVLCSLPRSTLSSQHSTLFIKLYFNIIFDIDICLFYLKCIMKKIIFVLWCFFFTPGLILYWPLVMEMEMWTSAKDFNFNLKFQIW